MAINPFGRNWEEVVGYFLLFWTVVLPGGSVEEDGIYIREAPGSNPTQGTLHEEGLKHMSNGRADHDLLW